MSPRLTVATYNLYLGADLSLVMDVDDRDELAVRLEEVVRQLMVTDFAGRAEAVARVVVEHGVDVLGLQEVCTWRVDGEVVSDYRALLLTALEDAGVPFDPMSEVETFAGGALVPGPNGEHRVDLLGTNLILCRRDAGMVVSDAGAGIFADALTMQGPAGGSIAVARGWCAVRCEAGGEPVVVIDTHTEAYDPESRDAQRDELLKVVAGVAADEAVVLLGDFNAVPEHVGLPEEYVDAWTAAGPEPDLEGVVPGGAPGATCGQRPDLRNEVSDLSQRIDYVWARGVKVTSATRAGHRDRDRTESGLWPSDHAAVVAEISW